jgi:site-specific DNA-methyltransferase (adenine-specific)
MLYNEDWLNGFRRFTEATDVVVTSPPYNLGVNYNTYDDDIPRDAYLRWTERWIAAVAFVLKKDGSFFLNMGGKPSDMTGPFDVLEVARKFFKLQNVIHWIKSINVDGVTRGHCKPINSDRYLTDQHEYIFHLTHNGDVLLNKLAVGVEYADKSNLTRGSRGKNGDCRDRGNTWFINYATRREKKSHPTTFPVELPEWCIKLHGVDKAKLVVDPFMGSGTTAVAGVRLGVPKVAGFEIDTLYHAAAVTELCGQQL